MLELYVKSEVLLRNWIQDLKEREDGQAMIEYSLIAALVSIAAILIIPGVGTAISNTWTKISNAFK